MSAHRTRHSFTTPPPPPLLWCYYCCYCRFVRLNTSRHRPVHLLHLLSLRVNKLFQSLIRGFAAVGSELAVWANKSLSRKAALSCRPFAYCQSSAEALAASQTASWLLYYIVVAWGWWKKKMRRWCTGDNSAEAIFISYTHELETEQTFLWWSVKKPPPACCVALCLFYRSAYGPLGKKKKISHHCCTVCWLASASKQCMMESSFFISSTPTCSVYTPVCVWASGPHSLSTVSHNSSDYCTVLYCTVEDLKTCLTTPHRRQNASGLLGCETQPCPTDWLVTLFLIQGLDVALVSVFKQPWHLSRQTHTQAGRQALSWHQGLHHCTPTPCPLTWTRLPRPSSFPFAC